MAERITIDELRARFVAGLSSEARARFLQGIPLRPGTIVRGYAAAPGSGPAGETCGSCKFKERHAGGSKRWYKCRLVTRSTGNPKTDIRLRTAACEKWEARI